MTLANLQSSGNMPVVKQQLKTVEIYGKIRSAHSQKSQLDSLSRPAPLDLFI